MTLELYCSSVKCFIGLTAGLVVWERDLNLRGREFESSPRILDGHFSNFLVSKFYRFEQAKNLLH